MTHITITISDDGKNARVISFDTVMNQKEVFQALSVSATLLKHYYPLAAGQRGLSNKPTN